MSREFPDWINPWSSAEGRREFRGSLALARLERLRPLLQLPRAATGGERAEDTVRFELRCSLDQDRRPRLDLRVEAQLPLQCQASLEVYREPVDRRVSLGVIESEAEEELLPPHLEPVLATEGRLAIAALVEDELLLALPQVPRKPGLDPVSWGREAAEDEAVEAGETRRPFAGLADLIKGERGNGHD